MGERIERCALFPFFVGVRGYVLWWSLRRISMISFSPWCSLLICWQTYLSLLFAAQKVAKRHSTDKISHSLLCSGILQAKYPSFGVRLPATFPWKTRECQIWPHFVCQKICLSFPCLSAAVACDFDSAVFWGDYLCYGYSQPLQYLFLILLIIHWVVRCFIAAH